MRFLRHSSKICGPHGVTLHNWTPIFERYMTGLVVNNVYEKDMSCDEIGLCAQEEAPF
jgi:hypothetical protein